MKMLILIAAGLLALQGVSFSQCPASGLKIESAACESPRNLQVDTVSCTELQIKWLGSQAQSYVVKATGTDLLSGSSYETTPSRIVCDNNGVCSTTLPVRDGSSVTWSVQAVCAIQGAALYSSEVTGTTTRIPACQKTGISDDKAIHVYPNPANDYLIVQYTGRIATTTIEFRILDISGKKQFSRFDGTTAKTNGQYRLDVRSLPPGIYLLEASSDKSVHQRKFIILRN